MKSENLIPAKNVPIEEVSFDHLLRTMSEWSNRIAKGAYKFFAASGFTDGHDLEHWLKAEQELLKPVPVEIKDLKGEFVVKADVPGFETEDLDVRLNESHLVISGARDTKEETKDKAGETVYSECKCNQIYRTVELPSAVVADKATAELKNGVLELKLPKAEKAKQIKISAA